jgi:hypothetical protein
MIVRIAIINTVSICTTGFISIRRPYAPAGMRISKSIVTTVTEASMLGATNFLIPEKENSIYITINKTQIMIALKAADCIYAHTLGHVIEDWMIPSLSAI